MLSSLIFLLAAAPAQGQWLALPAPSLSRPISTLPGVESTGDGRHLRRRQDGSRQSDPAVPPLPRELLSTLYSETAVALGLDVRLQSSASPLLARGDEKARAALLAVAAGLEGLEEALAIELEVWLLPGRVAEAPAAGQPAVAGGLHFLRSVRPGEKTVFGRGTVRSLLSDWSVDVAANSGVADPEILMAITGSTIQLSAARTRDGASVLLRGLLDHAELLSVERLDPAAPELGLIQKPRVAFSQVHFSGSVRADTHLRVELAGEAPGVYACTLFVRATTRKGPIEIPGWRVLDLSTLQRGQDLPACGPGYGLQTREGSELFARKPARKTAAALSAGTLVSMAMAEAGGGTARPVWSEDLLFLPLEDSELIAEVEALLRAFEEPVSGTQILAVGGRHLRANLPVAVGEHARLMVGIETLELVDYDTELAPESWMPEPRVSQTFDGLMIQLWADRVGIRAGAWVSESEKGELLDRDDTLLGRLYLPLRSLRSGSLRMRAGQKGSLFDATSGALGFSLSSQL